MLISTPFLAAIALASQAAPEPAEQSATPESDAPKAEETEQVGPEKSEAEAKAKAEKKANEDKIICRRTAVVGSKFKKRICGTKKQWEEMARRGQDNALEFQQRGNGFEPVN